MLFAFAVVRFVGMGTNNKTLYIIGGICMIAAMALKQYSPMGIPERAMCGGVGSDWGSEGAVIAAAAAIFGGIGGSQRRRRR